MKTHFDHLLPFYVNGTLGADDHAAIDDYLRRHPQASEELRWLRSVQAATIDEAVPASSEVGLARALARIRAERAAAAPTLLQRTQAWLARLVPPPVRGPALAGALAILALQTVVLSSLLDEREAWSVVRGVPHAGFETGPYVRLNFRPDAREEDIRLLLTQVQGTLASGPGQLGDYFVRVPAAQLADITTRLGASPIVQGLAVVDALPPQP
jgi:hypothetical protein